MKSRSSPIVGLVNQGSFGFLGDLRPEMPAPVGACEIINEALDRAGLEDADGEKLCSHCQYVLGKDD
jgi:hypothetical protein